MAKARFDANAVKPVRQPAASRLSLREWASKAVPVAHELVTVTYGGETREFKVCALSAGGRWAIEQDGFERVDDDHNRPLPTRLYPALLRDTVRDPQSDEPVFAPGDEEMIGQMDGDITAPLIAAALRLAGWGGTAPAEGEEAGEGNDGAASSTVPAAAGSDSV